MSNTTAARRASASDPGVDAVAATLRGLCDELRRAAAAASPGEGDPSVANMRAYLALRGHDNRALQDALARAEITDAASGARAECVMLNKGPMIVAAIATLDDILERMATHRHKKTSLLRRLRAWSPEPST